MKSFSLLLLFASIALLRAQSTNAPGVQTSSTSASVAEGRSTNAASFQPDALSVEVPKLLQPSVVIPLQPKPNEMFLGNVKASGIVIEAVKTREPLRLVNPFSPPTNSSPEDNVVRDPFNGKVNGLKVFAIHF